MTPYSRVSRSTERLVERHWTWSAEARALAGDLCQATALAEPQRPSLSGGDHGTCPTSRETGESKRESECGHSLRAVEPLVNDAAVSHDLDSHLKAQPGQLLAGSHCCRARLPPCSLAMQEAPAK